MPIGPCARECRRRGRLEILLVADVRNGAFVLFAVGARRERILAAGDQVVGADGELAAPGRAPGQADAQARPLLLAGRVDDRADDVGAERTVVEIGTGWWWVVGGQYVEIRGGAV